jgi:histidyl-tRNA synthetase
MPELKAPRGVDDLLPQDQPYWRWLKATATRVAESYGYGEIQTPVFEHAGVWLRPGADGTDIVDKEMYRFEDRGGDDLVLRPEGTAGVVRAYLEHGMSSQSQPVRLFYFIDVFRYDRPQAGRYRVHHQFGVEAIGDGDPALDAEVIDLLHTFYRELGLQDFTVLLNSIGDANCRPQYIEKLKAYYADKIDGMCADCRRRYDVNPLRLLDCKNEPCQPFKADAPRLVDNLCDPCREHFDTVKALLDDLGITYQLDPLLVRGLDYYTRTAFEFQPAVEGSQSAMGGGGRYDGLVEQLGGKPTPAIGFGTGLERLIINLKRQELEPPPAQKLDVFIAVADRAAQGRAMTVARTLREAGLGVLVGAGGRSLKAQMRQANAFNVDYALIIGAQELASGTVAFRDLATGLQESLSPEDVIAKVALKDTIAGI